MKWININDELPKDKQKVLISFEYSDEVECGYIRKANKYDDFYQQDDDKKYLMCFMYPEDLIHPVYELSDIKCMFWMPFPNQPERLSEKTSKEDAIV